MSEQGEPLKPSVGSPTSPTFREAALKLKRGLGEDIKRGGEISIDEVLQKVFDWENTYGSKVLPEEVSALQTLSLVLSTVKFFTEHRQTDLKRAMRESIETQHEILRTLFSNLKEDGRPNETVERSLSLVLCAFENYLDPQNIRLKESGMAMETGVWQGAMGMITTALLFKGEGWDVSLSPVDMDMNHDVDLLVRNPEGQIFTVDVTSRIPEIDKNTGEMDESFYIKEEPVKRSVNLEMSGLAGNFRINVPPIKLIEAEKFYEKKVTGFPSEEAFAKFRKGLKMNFEDLEKLGAGPKRTERSDEELLRIMFDMPQLRKTLEKEGVTFLSSLLLRLSDKSFDSEVREVLEKHSKKD